MNSNLFQKILSFLPISPFKNVISTLETEPFQDFFSMLNWFVPVSEIITIMEFYLVAVTGYYIWMIVLRWLQAIK